MSGTTAVAALIVMAVAIAPAHPSRLAASAPSVSAVRTPPQGAQYFLLPGPAATVVVDSRITLAIYETDPNGDLSASSVSVVTGVGWMVNGKPLNQQDASVGTLRAQAVIDRATYTAPHVVPARNPVALSVTFSPPGGKASITLVCNVTIRDQGNFVTIAGPKRPPSRYELSDQYSSPQMRSLMAHATSVGPELQILVNPLSASTVSPDLPATASVMMMLLVAGKTPGTYDWSLPGSSATVVTLQIATEQYLSADCQPHGSPSCQTVPLSGFTQITSVDAATNTVRGSFAGQLVQIVAGKPTYYVAVTGGFNVAMQGVAGQIVQTAAMRERQR